MTNVIVHQLTEVVEEGFAVEHLAFVACCCLMPNTFGLLDYRWSYDIIVFKRLHVGHLHKNTSDVSQFFHCRTHFKTFCGHSNETTGSFTKCVLRHSTDFTSSIHLIIELLHLHTFSQVDCFYDVTSSKQRRGGLALTPPPHLSAIRNSTEMARSFLTADVLRKSLIK